MDVKTAITTSSFAKLEASPLDLLHTRGLAPAINPEGRKLDAAEVVEFLQGVAGVIAGTEPLDADVLNALPDLKVISRCGAGMENVDLEAAAGLGIRVFNTPGAPTLPVAELTVGLILDLLRKVSLMDRNLRRGLWNKLMGSLLFGKKVGIVGFGRIGQKTAELLLPFGVKIKYCDTFAISCSLDCEPSDFEELLEWADIVTLHCPSPASGEPLLGSEGMGRLKEGAFLINAARGGLVDEDALRKALTDGNLAGAALDVFENEPYKGPLTELDNVILTPHIGSYAAEARVAMERQSVENLLCGLEDTGLL